MSPHAIEGFAEMVIVAIRAVSVQPDAEHVAASARSSPAATGASRAAACGLRGQPTGTAATRMAAAVYECRGLTVGGLLEGWGSGLSSGRVESRVAVLADAWLSGGGKEVRQRFEDAVAARRAYVQPPLL